MLSFSSLNDIICELVKKPFSAWATAQQNIIVKQKPCKNHENMKSHMNAFKTWKIFSAREACDQRVDVMILQAREEIKVPQILMHLFFRSLCIYWSLVPSYKFTVQLSCRLFC